MKKAEEELKRFHKTMYYQVVFYRRLEDTIIDRKYKLIRACTHLGDRWKRVKQYLSTEQKEHLHELVKIYGRNRRVRRVAVRAANS